MSDRDLKKLTETTQLPRKGTVSVSSVPAPAPDPFDDDGLDAVLSKALDEGAEPRLLLVDKLLTRTRVRREC